MFKRKSPNVPAKKPGQSIPEKRRAAQSRPGRGADADSLSRMGYLGLGVGLTILLVLAMLTAPVASSAV